MKIFVGNLSPETTEDDLRQAFESFGKVKSVTIVTNAGADKSQRFGFVIMSSAREAENAIQEMNGADLKGQRIKVEKSHTNAEARRSRRKRSVFGAGSGANPGRGGTPGGRRGKRRH